MLLRNSKIKTSDHWSIYGSTNFVKAILFYLFSACIPVYSYWTLLNNSILWGRGIAKSYCLNRSFISHTVQSASRNEWYIHKRIPLYLQTFLGSLLHAPFEWNDSSFM